MTESIGSSQRLTAAGGLAGDAHGSAIILSRGASSSDEFCGCDDALVTEAAAAADDVFFLFGCDTQYSPVITVKCLIILMHCLTMHFYYVTSNFINSTNNQIHQQVFVIKIFSFSQQTRDVVNNVFQYLAKYEPNRI